MTSAWRDREVLHCRAGIWSGTEDSRHWMCRSMGSMLDSRENVNKVMQEEKEIAAFRATGVGYYLASVKIQGRDDKAGQTDGGWARSWKAPNVSWGLSILFSRQRHFLEILQKRSGISESGLRVIG